MTRDGYLGTCVDWLLETVCRQIPRPGARLSFGQASSRLGKQPEGALHSSNEQDRSSRWIAGNLCTVNFLISFGVSCHIALLKSSERRQIC